MCYEVIPTERFKKDLQYYIKKKKFNNIIDDIEKVTDKLKQGDLIGDSIPALKKINTGNHTYKVRVANTDTRVGKSNGYRIIYYAIKDDKRIYLLTIYYKKEDKNIPTNTEIEQLVKNLDDIDT